MKDTVNKDKDKILLHVKGLKSRSERVYEASFNFLINIFYTTEEDYNMDDLTFLEQYELITYMLLPILQILKEEEDYENMEMVNTVYKVLYQQAAKEVYTQEDAQDFKDINENFQTDFYQINKKD